MSTARIFNLVRSWYKRVRWAHHPILQSGHLRPSLEVHFQLVPHANSRNPSPPKLQCGSPASVPGKFPGRDLAAGLHRACQPIQTCGIWEQTPSRLASFSIVGSMFDKLDWRGAGSFKHGCGQSLNAMSEPSLALLDKTLEQFDWRIPSPLLQLRLPVSARQRGHTGPWSNPKIAPWASPYHCAVQSCAMRSPSQIPSSFWNRFLLPTNLNGAFLIPSG